MKGKIINFIDKQAKGELYGVEILSLSSLGRLKPFKIIVCTSMVYWKDIQANLNDKLILFKRFHDFNIYRESGHYCNPSASSTDGCKIEELN